MDEMKARSAFTGIPLVVSGFDQANEMENKLKTLRELLRRSGSNEASIDAVIASRLRNTAGLEGRTMLSPIIGEREYFKRSDDGSLFRCEASTFGCVALFCEQSQERDVANLNDGEGWKSATHHYTRIPPIRRSICDK